MPTSHRQKILIIDENGFSRVCSSLFKLEGYKAEILQRPQELIAFLDSNEYGVIVTSYPFGEPFFGEIRKRDIPTIILFDFINCDVINALEGFRESHCMLKPLDFDKFRGTVKAMMEKRSGGERRVGALC